MNRRSFFAAVTGLLSVLVAPLLGWARKKRPLVFEGVTGVGWEPLLDPGIENAIATLTEDPREDGTALAAIRDVTGKVLFAERIDFSEFPHVSKGCAAFVKWANHRWEVVECQQLSDAVVVNYPATKPLASEELPNREIAIEIVEMVKSCRLPIYPVGYEYQSVPASGAVWTKREDLA